MRLRLLNPAWVIHSTAKPTQQSGLVFDCPCCKGEPGAIRLRILFDRYLDGSPYTTTLPTGVVVSAEGSSFDDLTVHDRINPGALNPKLRRHWSGYISKGEVR